MAAHVLLFAFVNVAVCTVAFVPLLLVVLDMGKMGWRTIDAALFGAMLGSTDAVAVTAILKGGGKQRRQQQQQQQQQLWWQRQL
jgi:NhaP-type Na+/H+ or K+/H+ antiporter